MNSFVTASADRTARVWEARTGRPVAELRGHTDRLTRAAFSPDGRWIVTSSDDDTARVWNARTGRIAAELRGNSGNVSGAQFSPDGRLVVMASAGAPAQVFACELCGSLDDILALARARVTRELTAEERQRYLHVPYSQ